MKRSLQLVILVSTCTILWTSPPAAGETWQANGLALEMGSAITLPDGLRVSANESGQVYIALPPRNINLAELNMLRLEFGGTPPPAIFVLWHNDRQPGQLFQFRLPPQQQSPLLFDMREVPGWEGRATRLGIGLRLPPEQQVLVRSVSVIGPGLLTTVHSAWLNWSHFRPWKQTDINVYTGTRQFGEGPHPAPVVALLCLLALGIYLGVSRGRGRVFSLRTAGAIVLGAWLILDLFWQLRLGQQVSLTLKTFGGLEPSEKLLASSDAKLVRFAAAAKDNIVESDARVFIASASDGQGMRSAYYMSPLNTYWHRKGPELPPPERLGTGDYLLVIAPSAARYNPREGRLGYGDNQSIAVETLLRDRQGLLLRVAE